MSLATRQHVPSVKFTSEHTAGRFAVSLSNPLLQLVPVCSLCLQRVGQDSEPALRGAVEVLITEVFGDTERNLAKVCVDSNTASC